MIQHRKDSLEHFQYNSPIPKTLPSTPSPDPWFPTQRSQFRNPQERSQYHCDAAKQKSRKITFQNKNKQQWNLSAVNLALAGITLTNSPGEKGQFLFIWTCVIYVIWTQRLFGKSRQNLVHISPWHTLYMILTKLLQVAYSRGHWGNNLS